MKPIGLAAFGVAASFCSIVAAADSVDIGETEAVPYIRTCDPYGAGFFYVPGTDLCLAPATVPPVPGDPPERVAFASAIAAAATPEELARLLLLAAGEIHASASSVASATLGFNDLLLGRTPTAGSLPAASRPLAYAEGEDDAETLTTASRIAFWAEGFGAYRDVDDRGFLTGTETRRGGAAAGLELDLADRVPGLLLGAAIGYATQEIAAASTASELDSDDFHVAIHGRIGADPGVAGFSAAAAFGYAHHSIGTRRSIAPAGVTARADYDADSVAGSIEARSSFAIGGAGPVTGPFARLDTAHFRRESFAERGAGAFNLASAEDGDTSAALTLGWTVSGRSAIGGRVLASSFSLGWNRRLDDPAKSATLFSPGSTATIAPVSADDDRDALILDGGFAYDLHSALRMNGGLRALVAPDSHAIEGHAGLSLRF